MKHLNFIYLISALFLISCGGSKSSMDTIKGNREPSTQITQVKLFHTIEVSGDFEIGLVKGPQPSVEILTDSNLHDVLDARVISGVLSIRTLKRIKSMKKMEIRVTYTNELKEILVKEDGNVYSITDIQLENISLVAREKGRLALTVKCDNVIVEQYNDSNSELNIEADAIQVKLHENADMEALINAKNLNLGLVGRSDARIDGDISSGNYSLKDKAELEAKRLDARELNLQIENNARAEVAAIKSFNLSSLDDGETRLYGNPQISISEFKDESKLLKEN